MGSSVGIVVRTKDRPLLLARALRDIAAQTYQDWTVVVVNDGGSLDEVESAIAASTIGADRIVALTTSKSTGRCAAANQGIRALDSDLVVLHDDDDLWDPAFLDTTVRWLDTHPSDLAVVVPTEIVVEEWDGTTWRAAERRPFWQGMTRISLAEMLGVNRAVPISVVYRRSVHEQVGWYDETLETVEDWDFYLRILVDGSIGFIEGPVLAYWTHRPSAAGASANSMFDLADSHLRDDHIVRDRALSAWVRVNGLGLPLYLAAIERRLSEQIEAGFEQSRQDLDRSFRAWHPAWTRMKKLKQRFRRTEN